MSRSSKWVSGSKETKKEKPGKVRQLSGVGDIYTYSWKEGRGSSAYKAVWYPSVNPQGFQLPTFLTLPRKPRFIPTPTTRNHSDGNHIHLLLPSVIHREWAHATAFFGRLCCQDACHGDHPCSAHIPGSTIKVRLPQVLKFRLRDLRTFRYSRSVPHSIIFGMVE